MWLAVGPLGEVGPLARALAHATSDGFDEAFVQTGETDALGAARAAFDSEHKGAQTPPIEWRFLFVARNVFPVARIIGTVSRVFGTVRRALIDPPGHVVARIEERGAGEQRRRILVLTMVNETFRDALKRDGATIVTDAGAEMNVPIMARVVGYDPPFHKFNAADGAPIERVLLRSRRANRAGWLDGGRLVLGAGVVQAVTDVVDWVLEQPDTKTVLVVTMQVVELALRAALGEDVSREWAKQGQPAKTLEEARAALAPVLARLPAPPGVAHYGGVRGLDGWKDVDAVVTLGDPWTNKGDAQHEADFLGLTAWEERYQDVCRAELEQAHGRIRAPRRTRPGRALHVGVTLPGGWRDVAIRRPPEGRPPNPASDVAELQALVRTLGGPTAAARLADCGLSAIKRYVAGERGVPPSLLGRLRSLAAEGQQGVA